MRLEHALAAAFPINVLTQSISGLEVGAQAHRELVLAKVLAVRLLLGWQSIVGVQLHPLSTSDVIC